MHDLVLAVDMIACERVSDIFANGCFYPIAFPKPLVRCCIEIVHGHELGGCT